MKMHYYDTQKRYNDLLSLAVELSHLNSSAISERRKHPNIMWRYAIYLQLRYEGHSYSNIAKVSNKDHSTIYNDCQQMINIIKYNPNSQFADVWRLFSSSVSVPEIEKKFVTTTSVVENWLDCNHIPAEHKANLMNTISSISI